MMAEFTDYPPCPKCREDHGMCPNDDGSCPIPRRPKLYKTFDEITTRDFSYRASFYFSNHGMMCSYDSPDGLRSFDSQESLVWLARKNEREARFLKRVAKRFEELRRLHLVED